MKKILKKYLVLVSGLFVISPAFADTTVNLETSTSITISGVETLDFGTIDALGFNSANHQVLSTAGTTGIIKMTFLNTANSTSSTEPPANMKKGTVYYLEDALVLKVSTSSLSVGIDVKNEGSLTALITEDASDWSNSGVNLSSFMLKDLDSLTFKTGLVNGSSVPIDIGVYVPLSEEGGSKTSVITFTVREN